MEHFDERTSKRIKEKNVYLLHLDTPRIIIISSVIIGVVIIAFLFGMNLNKENHSSSSKDIFSQKEQIFEIPNPDVRNNPGSTNPLSNSPIEKGLSLNLPENVNSAKNAYMNVLPENSEGRMELYPDKMTKVQKDVIPSIKEVTKQTQKKNDSTSYSHNKISKKAKVKVRNRKKWKRNNIIGVSSKNRNKHYSIQIASFDRRSKAVSVRNRLKRQHYNAYIDRTSVKGKKYYRVRIGPISSKKKAVRVLTDIQGSSRYEESYMIRE